MSWPATFDDPTRDALILVPPPDAMVQDLGAHLSGREFETDLLPGSALVCAADGDRPVVGKDGLVRFSFEGNMNGAVNLKRYHERCLAAAGRLATRYPSIAYGSARPEDLTLVARYDLLRFVFTDIIDAAAIEDWCGEAVESFLPPADLPTPNTDPAVLKTLCELPMRFLAQGKGGVYAWLLEDGTILSKDERGTGALTAWRRGDAGLTELLERAGLELSRRMMLA